jgi:hypothetical protein
MPYHYFIADDVASSSTKEGNRKPMVEANPILPKTTY